MTTENTSIFNADLLNSSVETNIRDYQENFNLSLYFPSSLSIPNPNSSVDLGSGKFVDIGSSVSFSDIAEFINRNLSSPIPIHSLKNFFAQSEISGITITNGDYTPPHKVSEFFGAETPSNFEEGPLGVFNATVSMSLSENNSNDEYNALLTDSVAEGMVRVVPSGDKSSTEVYDAYDKFTEIRIETDAPVGYWIKYRVKCFQPSAQTEDMFNGNGSYVAPGLFVPHETTPIIERFQSLSKVWTKIVFDLNNINTDLNAIVGSETWIQGFKVYSYNEFGLNKNYDGTPFTDKFEVKYLYYDRYVMEGSYNNYLNDVDLVYIVIRNMNGALMHVWNTLSGNWLASIQDLTRFLVSNSTDSLLLGSDQHNSAIKIIYDCIKNGSYPLDSNRIITARYSDYGSIYDGKFRGNSRSPAPVYYNTVEGSNEFTSNLINNGLAFLPDLSFERDIEINPSNEVSDIAGKHTVIDSGYIDYNAQQEDFYNNHKGYKGYYYQEGLARIVEREDGTKSASAYIYFKDSQIPIGNLFIQAENCTPYGITKVDEFPGNYGVINTNNNLLNLINPSQEVPQVAEKNNVLEIWEKLIFEDKQYLVNQANLSHINNPNGEQSAQNWCHIRGSNNIIYNNQRYEDLFSQYQDSIFRLLYKDFNPDANYYNSQGFGLNKTIPDSPTIPYSEISGGTYIDPVDVQIHKHLESIKFINYYSRDCPIFIKHNLEVAQQLISCFIIDNITVCVEVKEMNVTGVYPFFDSRLAAVPVSEIEFEENGLKPGRHKVKKFSLYINFSKILSEDFASWNDDVGFIQNLQRYNKLNNLSSLLCSQVLRGLGLGTLWDEYNFTYSSGTVRTKIGGFEDGTQYTAGLSWPVDLTEALEGDLLGLLNYSIVASIFEQENDLEGYVYKNSIPIKRVASLGYYFADHEYYYGEYNVNWIGWQATKYQPTINYSIFKNFLYLSERPFYIDIIVLGLLSDLGYNAQPLGCVDFNFYEVECYIGGDQTNGSEYWQ